MTPLTPDLLLSLGFEEVADRFDEKVYRLKLPMVTYQVGLSEYPNGCYMGVYNPEEVVDDYDEDDNEIKTTLPEDMTCFAWNVTTLERLNQIYVALTEQEPLIPKER